MNKFLCIAILFLGTFHTACRKDKVVITNNPLSQIQDAKHFFDIEIQKKLHLSQHDSNSIGKYNPRKRLDRKPVWDKAYVTRLSSGTAVVVPVHYNTPFIIRSNIGGSKSYNSNDLTKLLIYQDKNKLYHAQIILLVPDSNYDGLRKERFTGILFIEDWLGTHINKFKYEKSGTIKKFNLEKYNSSLSSSVLETTRNLEIQPTLRQNGSITVCYEVHGYNYSPDDPYNGEYWSESAGCNTYYDDSYVESDDVNGGDYRYISSGDSGGGSGGGEGSPAMPVNNLIVTSGDNIISNIKDYNKCFNNIPGNAHSYEVKLCVTQPEPGTREAWNLANASGSYANGNPVSVGHTFLILTETTPTQTITRNVGFYPQSGVSPNLPTVQGQLNNDEVHDYDISLSIKMTNHEFTEILSFISQGNDPGFTYNLNTNNCTTFALNALASTGINITRTTGSWLNGGGLNPGDLGEDLRNMTLQSNMSRNTSFVHHPNLGVCY